MLGERRGAFPFPAAPTEAGAGPRKGVKSLKYFVLLTRLGERSSGSWLPTTTNYAVEFPAFGEIAGVSTSGVQWISLALGKPPS